MPKLDSPAAPAEDIFKETLNRIRTVTDEGVQCTLAYTRESPMKALGWAALGGYLLRFLPVRALLGAIVDLVFLLIRPIALIFGAMKVYNFAVRNFTNERAAQKRSSNGGA